MGLGKWLRKLRGDEQAGGEPEEESKDHVDVDAIKLDQEAGRLGGMSGPDEAARLGPPDDA